jgi:hypothetical protein
MPIPKLGKESTKMEVLLGTLSDVRFLRNYLRNARSLSAYEYVSGRHLINLEQVRDGAWPCNWLLFEQIIDHAVEYLETALDCGLQLIPFNRWFLMEHDGTVGGFYSKSSYGYCDILGLAFTATPVGRCFSSEDDRALELARGYLHDCFHASTFRSYGVKRGGSLSNPKSPPTVYRFQHGFNFRTIDGISYSPPPDATLGTSINLGIMMDGIGSIMSGEAIKSSLELLKPTSISIDLIQDVGCSNPIRNGQRFFKDVIIPTQEFFRLYKIIPMAEYAKVMITGNVSYLGKIFAESYGISWDNTFRQDKFPCEIII